MKIKIKLFDQSLPMPEYHSEKAAALDLYSRETVTILPHQVKQVPLNIALEIPDDYWVLLSARSSLYKRGVMMANGIGVGDADYCGENDEYRATLFNYTDATVEIPRGERIVQMMVLARPKLELEPVTELTGKNRGGFGSTGAKAKGVG